jgi:hypothetical protein
MTKDRKPSNIEYHGKLYPVRRLRLHRVSPEYAKDLQTLVFEHQVFFRLLRNVIDEGTKQNQRYGTKANNKRTKAADFCLRLGEIAIPEIQEEMDVYSDGTPYVLPQGTEPEYSPVKTQTMRSAFMQMIRALNPDGSLSEEKLREFAHWTERLNEEFYKGRSQEGNHSLPRVQNVFRDYKDFLDNKAKDLGINIASIEEESGVTLNHCKTINQAESSRLVASLSEMLR